MAEQHEIQAIPGPEKTVETDSNAVLIHPDVIEKAASRILDSVENIHAREKLKQYLASDKELENHYEAYRDGLNRMLLQFREEADDTSIGAHAEQLHRDFEAGFDAALLKLFEIIDVKGNSQLRDRILANTQIPPVHLLSLNSKFTLGEAVQGAAEDVIYINPDSDQTYEQFKKTFLHEFLHVYVQDISSGMHARNKPLNEGITEMLAKDVLEKFIDDDCYPKNVELARSLFALDKDALMDWYTGGSTENFQFLLKEKLTPVYGDKEAQALVDELFSLFMFVLQRKLVAAKSALALLDEMDVSINYNDLYGYMFGRISFDQLENRHGEFTPNAALAILNAKIPIYKDLDEPYDRLRDKFLFAASQN